MCIVIKNKDFKNFCEEYKKQNPGFYRKWCPSPLWPILFQKMTKDGFKTIAQTEPPPR